MRPPWTRIWSLTLSTSSPHTHTRDGAKTHVSPSVIPPHCGATGNDVDGSCSGPGGTFVPDTLSLGVPTRQRGPLRQAGWDSGSTASSRAARGPRRTGRPRAARGSHLQGHKPQRWGWPSDPPLGAACECGLPGRAGGAADRPPPQGGMPENTRYVFALGQSGLTGPGRSWQGMETAGSRRCPLPPSARGPRTQQGQQH